MIEESHVGDLSKKGFTLTQMSQKILIRTALQSNQGFFSDFLSSTYRKKKDQMVMHLV